MDGAYFAASMVARERSFQGGKGTTAESSIGKGLAEVDSGTHLSLGQPG